MLSPIVNTQVTDDGIKTESNPSNVESVNTRTSESIVKSSLAAEAENKIIGTGNKCLSNVTGCLLKEIKVEAIDIEPGNDTSAREDIMCNLVFSQSVESYPRLGIEKDVKDELVEDTVGIVAGDTEESINKDQKRVIKTVASHAVVENQNYSLVESGVRLHKEEEIYESEQEIDATLACQYATTKNYDDSVMKCDVNLVKEEDIEEYIEEIKEEVTWTFENELTATENNKDTVFESAENFLEEEDKEKVARTSRDKNAVTANYDETVVKCDESLFKGEGKEAGTSVNKHDVKLLKEDIEEDKNDSSMSYVDGCQQSTISYDFSSIKLDDVSVNLVDLFEEIARLYPQIPIQRHINAKFCPCIFCTGKYKLPHPVKDYAEINRSKRASGKRGSDKVESNSALAPYHTLIGRIVKNRKSGLFIGKSKQSKLYFDPTQSKLTNVSVILKDLFLEIESHDSRKPLQRHINSKNCSCIFCAKKFKLQKLINFTEGNTSQVATELRHRGEDNLGESTYGKWNLCTRCPAQFRYMYSLTRHSAMHHHVYMCSKCLRKFQFEADLQTHLKTHSTDDKYLCVFCPFKGRVEPELEIHARSHSAKTFFSCAECRIEFSKSYNLLSHLQKHTTKKTTVESLKKKPVSNVIFIDPKPSYSFRTCSSKQSLSNAAPVTRLNQLSNINSSLTTDTNTQSFSSSNSSLKIITKSSVTHSRDCLPHTVRNQNAVAHIESTYYGRSNVSKKYTQSSHRVGGPFGEWVNKKWHCCTLCPARFRFLHSLRKHCAMNHHMHMCFKCPRRFLFDFDLQSHLKTHAANESYFCAFCPFKGRVEAELEIHARIHSNAKVFACSLCLQEFDKDYRLLDHIQKHTCLEDFTEFQNQMDLRGHTAVHLYNEPILDEAVSVRSEDDALSDENSVYYSNNEHVLNEEVDFGSEDDAFSKNVVLYSNNEPVLNKRVDFGLEDGAMSGENSVYQSNNEPALNEKVDFYSEDDVSLSENFVLYSNNEPVLNKKFNFGSEDDAMSGENSVYHSNNEPALNEKVDFDSEDDASLSENFVLYLNNESVLNKKVDVWPNDGAPFVENNDEPILDENVDIAVHSKSKPISNEELDRRPEDNITSSENVAHFISSRSPVDSEATFSKKGDTAGDERPTQLTDFLQLQLPLGCTEDVFKISSLKRVYSAAQSRLKRSRMKISVGKQMNCDYEEHWLSSETVCKKARISYRDSSDSNINVSSLQIESMPVNTSDCSQQLGTSFDTCGTKLIHVSVVLEDLFQKISRENLEKPVNRHINSNLCRCVFCTGTFKPLNEMKMETKMNKITAGPSICSEQYIGEHVNKTWISCILCPARFKFNHSLTRHCAIDHDVHLCTECFQKFEVKLDLQMHLKKHSRNKLYFCSFCSFKSKVEAELKIHARIHILENLFSCALCFIEFKKSNSLMAHILMHTTAETIDKSENEKNLSGHSAVYSNDDSSNLQRRSPLQNVDMIQIMGKEEPLPLVSDGGFECTTSTAVENDSIIRSSLVENPNQKQFLDNHIAVFKTKGHPNPHLSGKLIKNSFYCSHCIAKFKTEDALMRHLEINLTIPPFYCQLCHATFKQKFLLRQHLARVHSIERPFCCQHCPAAFKKKPCLNRHLATVHASRRPFSCRQCHVAFKQKCHLKKHVATVHSEKKSVSFINSNALFKSRHNPSSYLAVGFFACPKCSATFKRKHNLKQHLITHSNKRPFSCPQCIATFKRNDNLTRHLALHTKKQSFSYNYATTFKREKKRHQPWINRLSVRPFSCPHCDVTFCWKDQLIRHLGIHSAS